MDVGLRKNAVYEAFGIERRQIVRALAKTHKLDRHAELLLHADHDAALGGTVKLGSTTPVMPMASANTLAWAMPFWPVVASSTSSTSSTGRFFR